MQNIGRGKGWDPEVPKSSNDRADPTRHNAKERDTNISDVSKKALNGAEEDDPNRFLLSSKDIEDSCTRTEHKGLVGLVQTEFHVVFLGDDGTRKGSATLYRAQMGEDGTYVRSETGNVLLFPGAKPSAAIIRYGQQKAEEMGLTFKSVDTETKGIDDNLR